MSSLNQESAYSFDLDGRTYSWTGKTWIDAKTYTKPPTVIVSRLNLLLQAQLDQDDARVTDPSSLLERARHARDSRQYERAIHLSRKVLTMKPGHPGALAILCSSHRASHAPERALEETNPFRHLSYAPLLTSRASAMCDLEMWDEAKTEIARVLSQPIDQTEAFLIVRRIKAAKPELYRP